MLLISWLSKKRFLFSVMILWRVDPIWPDFLRTWETALYRWGPWIDSQVKWWHSDSFSLFVSASTKIHHFNIVLTHRIKMWMISCLLDWRLLTQKTWKPNWKRPYCHQVRNILFSYFLTIFLDIFWRQMLDEMMKWMWLINITKWSIIGTIIKIALGYSTQGQRYTSINCW